MFHVTRMREKGIHHHRIDFIDICIFTSNKKLSIRFLFVVTVDLIDINVLAKNIRDFQFLSSYIYLHIY